MSLDEAAVGDRGAQRVEAEREHERHRQQAAREDPAGAGGDEQAHGPAAGAREQQRRAGGDERQRGGQRDAQRAGRSR